MLSLKASNISAMSAAMPVYTNISWENWSRDISPFGSNHLHIVNIIIIMNIFETCPG